MAMEDVEYKGFYLISGCDWALILAIQQWSSMKKRRWDSWQSPTKSFELRHWIRKGSLGSLNSVVEAESFFFFLHHIFFVFLPSLKSVQFLLGPFFGGWANQVDQACLIPAPFGLGHHRNPSEMAYILILLINAIYSKVLCSGGTREIPAILSCSYEKMGLSVKTLKPIYMGREEERRKK